MTVESRDQISLQKLWHRVLPSGLSLWVEDCHRHTLPPEHPITRLLPEGSCVTLKTELNFRTALHTKEEKHARDFRSGNLFDHC